MTLFQKPKHCNKLYKFPFFLPNHIPHNNHVIHYVFSPHIEKLLILCMLWFSKNVILPHVPIWFCNLALAPPNMFLEVVKFGNQKLLFAFNLWTNMTPNHVYFAIYHKHDFCPWKLCCPNILKNLINFPFPHPFFFFLHGVSVRHITTFCNNILYTNINFKCSAFGCTTNNTTTTTFIWRTNLDDIKDVSREKKLVLEPIQQLQRCHGVIKSKLELNGLAIIEQEQMK